jgi:YqaJ-like viral recombinase domain
MNAAAQTSPRDLAAASVPAGVATFPVVSLQQWLALREPDITASVGAALLGDGVHDYVTAYELWARKSKLTPPQEQTPAMRRGQLMEPVILQMLREDYPDWRFEQASRYYSDPKARIGATPDFFATRPDRAGFGVIDGKSVGKYAFRKGWKDADGDVAVPLWIAIQVTITAALAGASWAAVAPMQMGDGGLDLSLEEIPLRPSVMVRMRALVADFWRRVEENRPYDADWSRDAYLVSQLFDGEDGPTIDLSADTEVAGWLDEREALKSREKDGAAATVERKKLDGKLIDKLGNASGAHVGVRKFSVKIVRRGAYSVPATQYPQLTVKGPSARVASAVSPYSTEGPF